MKMKQTMSDLILLTTLIDCSVFVSSADVHRHRLRHTRAVITHECTYFNCIRELASSVKMCGKLLDWSRILNR
jgi:hypothetical protein